MSDQCVENLSKLLAQAGLGGDIDLEIRRIGTDDAMVEAIIERIAVGEKTMTYSLPWLAAYEQRREPVAGRYLLALGAGDKPRLLLRLTEVFRKPFGEIKERDIAREGIPLRTLDAWRPLHIAVWNEKLVPVGKQVTDEMPVWGEFFELVRVF